MWRSPRPCRTGPSRLEGLRFPSRSRWSATGPEARKPRARALRSALLVHPAGAVDLTGTGQIGGVDDRVRVALLGEEALPVGGVLAVEGVAADHRVEVRLPAVGLGPQHPAEALGLLLPRPERPRHLDGDGRLRQVDREVR